MQVRTDGGFCVKNMDREWWLMAQVKSITFIYLRQ